MSDLDVTRYFYELTPEVILTAVEEIGVRCSGRVMPLNSMENRVYEAEIETAGQQDFKSRHEAFRVVKFYRPGRWSRLQIEEEHRFLKDLAVNDIAVAAPLEFPSDQSTIHELSGSGIMFSVFPKIGGRLLDELDRPKLERLGRTIARLHLIGAARRAEHRLSISAESFGRSCAQYLLSTSFLPEEIRDRYGRLVEDICRITDGLMQGIAVQRVHGDLHCGNVIWRDDECLLVDFDDMATAPCVQDIWLIVPGRDKDALEKRNILLDAYRQLREFDYGELGLIEALRALRIIRFSSWIARRWDDPAFQRVFTEFGTVQYWREHLMTLEEQLCILQGGSWE